jgi:hypothetical protein
MVTSERDPVVDRDFPAAAFDGYALTSPSDPDYNCIAWATGDTEIWWWPTPYDQPGIYWPEQAPREATVRAFLTAYATQGWIDCELDASIETGFEKLALYVDANQAVQHAARQLPNGEWTSKLGKYKDIQHTSPAALETSSLGETQYGTVARYMKRRLQRP